MICWDGHGSVLAYFTAHTHIHYCSPYPSKLGEGRQIPSVGVNLGQPALLPPVTPLPPADCTLFSLNILHMRSPASVWQHKCGSIGNSRLQVIDDVPDNDDDCVHCNIRKLYSLRLVGRLLQRACRSIIYFLCCLSIFSAVGALPLTAQQNRSIDWSSKPFVCLHDADRSRWLNYRATVT